MYDTLFYSFIVILLVTMQIFMFSFDDDLDVFLMKFKNGTNNKPKYIVKINTMEYLKQSLVNY